MQLKANMYRFTSTLQRKEAVGPRNLGLPQAEPCALLGFQGLRDIGLRRTGDHFGQLSHDLLAAKSRNQLRRIAKDVDSGLFDCSLLLSMGLTLGQVSQTRERVILSAL